MASTGQFHGTSAPTGQMEVGRSHRHLSTAARTAGAGVAALAVLVGLSPAPLTAAASVNSDRLTSVACPTVTLCLAVGDHGSWPVSQTLIEQESNGGSWTAVISPNPSKAAAETTLFGISCGASTTCIAAGSYDDAAYNSFPLIEHWNGTTWTINSVPLPRGATSPSGSTNARLQGVYCGSATSCMAVGGYQVGSTTRPLVEQWNGTAWTATAALLPTHSAYGVFTSVSCPAVVGNCVAAGYSVSNSGTTSPLAEQLTSTGWAVMATPAVSPDGAAFEAVTCEPVAGCIAAGYQSNAQYSDATLVESWNGQAWSIQPTPNPGPNSALDGVTCQAPVNCIATGDSYDTSGIQHPLVEQWNGLSWSVGGTPDGPPGSLQQPSCVTPENCYAVGYAATGSSNAPTSATLVERLVPGGSWTIVPSANR